MPPDLSTLWTQCQADTAARRAKIYGLVLLRSNLPWMVVAQVLGMSGSYSRFKQRLSFLCQDYAAMLSDDTQSLRVDVRAFFRRQLLARRQDSEVQKIISTILLNQQARMRTIKMTAYPDIRSRLRDGAWTLVFLDLLEASFWSSPTTALQMALPLVLMTSLYRPDLVPTIYELVHFFEEQIDEPQHSWWMEVCQGLNIGDAVLPPGRQTESLKVLRTLLLDGTLVLTDPFVLYPQQVIAALWWQEGEIFREVELHTALTSYHEALNLLYPEQNMSLHTTRLYHVLSDMHSDPHVKIWLLERAVAFDPEYFPAYAKLGDLYLAQKSHRQALKYYHYAIELEHHHVELWVNLGVIYTFEKEYQRALDELDHAILLDSTHFLPYYNRANVYVGLKRYQEALQDYNMTLARDRTFMSAYINRGNVYAMLNQPEQAKLDYEEALRLEPSDLQALWLYEWINFGNQRIGLLEVQRLQTIVECDGDDDYLVQVCQGIVTAVTLHNLKKASEALERAQEQEPDQWDPPFWLAMLYAYRNRQEQARVALQQAIDLGLPVALLRPLYWLEKDCSEFFHRYALPVLQRYNVS